MNGHFLIKMVDMLYRIRLTIIKRESRLIKSPRKACTLYPPCKRRFCNLVQRFVHGLFSKALVRWILILTLMATIFLVARESFAGWSSRLFPVRGVLCIFRIRLRPKRWSPSPCATQLLLQFVNLTLHVSLILCMGDMTFPTRMTLISMRGLHTSFMISHLLRVHNWVITLETPWFRLVRTIITLIWPNCQLMRTWSFHFQH